MADTLRNRDVDNVDWARWYARVVGIVLVLVGLFGFATSDPLGIDFDLTPTHTWVHLVSGVVALYFGFASNLVWRTVAGFSMAFGAVYLALGLLGFAVTDIGDGLIFLTMPDNWLHIGIGVVGLLAGGASWAATGRDVRARRPAV